MEGSAEGRSRVPVGCFSRGHQPSTTKPTRCNLSGLGAQTGFELGSSNGTRWGCSTHSRLADLIKDVAPEARDPKVRLAFNLIYPAGRAQWSEQSESEKRGTVRDVGDLPRRKGTKHTVSRQFALTCAVNIPKP